MSDYLISATYSEVDSSSAKLHSEHMQLEQITQELNTKLKKAVWVSQSEQAFATVMAKYNQHMAELHAELDRLGRALSDAGGQLASADQKAASQFA